MIQGSYPATDQRRSDHSVGTNTTGSTNVASYSSARELFTRLDTGKRASKPFAAGLSNSDPADVAPESPACGRERRSGSLWLAWKVTDAVQ